MSSLPWEATASIDIVIDGAIYGNRSWSMVPRRGDLIVLRHKDCPDGRIAEIEQVAWGGHPDYEQEESNNGKVRCRLICKWSDDA